MKTIPSWISERLDRLAEHDEAMTLYARSAMSAADTKRQQLGETKQQIQSAVSVYAGMAEDDPSRLDHLRTEASRLEAAIEAHVVEYKRRQELAALASHAHTACRDWLSRLPEHTRLDPAPPVKIGNGDSRKLLDLVRRDIGEAHAKLTQLRQRPVERAEIAVQVGQEVARRAATAMTFHPARGISETHAVPLFGMLCAILPAEVTAHLTDSYMASYGHTGLAPISSPERAAAIAETEAKILDLGHTEEALVEQLLDLGPATACRRRDADARAVLGCVVVAKQAPPPVEPPELVAEAAE